MKWLFTCTSLIALGISDASQAATLSVLGYVQAYGQCEYFNAGQTSELSDGCIKNGSLPGVWSVAGASSARADLGSVGTGVAVLGSSEGSGFGVGSVTAVARASFSDSLIISQTTGFLSIPIDVFGVFGNYVNGVLPSSLNSYFSMTYNDGVSVSEHGFFERNYVATFDGPESYSFGIIGINTVRIPIIDGIVNFTLRSSGQAFCSTGDPSTNCNLTASFLNSARLLGASVYDESGQLVTDALIASDSGFDYLTGLAPHVSPVPLPPGLYLFASALLLSGALRRKWFLGMNRPGFGGGSNS
jgi:hypothetical protein